jgi:hypothetical protein
MSIFKQGTLLDKAPLKFYLRAVDADHSTERPCTMGVFPLRCELADDRILRLAGIAEE